MPYKDRQRQLICQSQATARRTSEARKECLDLLGGKCVVCGFDDHRALCVDHINGGGRKESKTATCRTAYYRAIRDKIKTGSNEYQVLCANHNTIKIHENNECKGIWTRMPDRCYRNA